MEPWSVVHERLGEPFAVETRLGWVVNGPVKPTKDAQIKVNRVKVREDVHQMVTDMYNEDSNDSSSIEDRGMSREDRLWVELVNSSCFQTKFETRNTLVLSVFENNLWFKSYNTLNNSDILVGTEVPYFRSC